MAEVFTAYLDAQKSERFLLKLAGHWKDTPLEDIRPETIRQAIKVIYPKANEPTWNRQVIKLTQAAINHAAELGWCQRISVKRYSENPKKKTPATLEWVTGFSDQAVKDHLPHLAALCLFMYGTAARIGEACNLLWGDVDLSSATATMHLFKPVPWTRTAHLPPNVVASLANIPPNRNPGDRVFGYAGRGSVRGPWNNVIKRPSLGGVSHWPGCPNPRETSTGKIYGPSRSVPPPLQAVDQVWKQLPGGCRLSGTKQ